MPSIEDLSGLIEFGRAFANLGDAVGSQWMEAITQFEAYGSQQPITDSESNPNAFSPNSYEAIRHFRNVLADSGVDGVEEFLKLVDADAGGEPPE